MVNLIGDLCIPSELIVPIRDGPISNQTSMSGALFISGAKLFFYQGGVARLITSA